MRPLGIALSVASFVFTIACSNMGENTAPTFAPSQVHVLPGTNAFRAESSDPDRVRVETTSDGGNTLMLWFDTDWERRGVEIRCYQYGTYPTDLRQVFSTTVDADQTPDQTVDFERSGWDTGRYFCQLQAVNIPANQFGVVVSFEFPENGEGGSEACVKPGQPLPEQPNIDCPPGHIPN